MRYLFMLLIATIGLSGLDLWCTCTRALIPMSINATIQKLELRNEKHPGIDDVCLMRISDNRLIQIDSHVYEELSVGDRLEKDRGDRDLSVNGAAVRLEWSQDTRGMARALPVVLTVALALTAMAALRQTSDRHITQ